MTHYNKRAYVRKFDKLPIEYSDCITDQMHDAMTLNYSKGGMLLESGRSLSPGSSIQVKVKSQSSEISTYGAYHGYAEVIWCKENNADAITPRYGIGIQCIVFECGLCKELIHKGKIQRTDDDAYLCSECYMHMSKMTDDKIKESIEDMIIGNVL